MADIASACGRSRHCASLLGRWIQSLSGQTSLARADRLPLMLRAPVLQQAFGPHTHRLNQLALQFPKDDVSPGRGPKPLPALQGQN